MSDQGFGPPGPGGPPEYGQQPPNYGQQPPYGEQPPPPGQQVPPYGQPPEYGQQPPQYGQQPPAYGPPPQYGRQPSQYGEQPQYPGGEYGQPQFNPYTGAAPANTGGGSAGSRKGLIAGVGTLVVAGIVVAILLLTGVFSSSASASSPTDAVKSLLDAGKKGDVSAAANTLCQSDIAAGQASGLDANGKVQSYTIGTVTQQDSNNATVQTTVTSEKGGPQSAKIPVVKEGGTWKVCFTKALTNLPTAGSTPGGASAPSLATSPSISLLPSSATPSITAPTGLGLGSYCASSTSAVTTATTFIGAIDIGSTELARGCVYPGTVSDATIKSVSGTSKLYAPTSSQTGPVFDFQSVDGQSKIRITVTKESDGKYYVTRIQAS
ncbi:MAG: hypothetical protein QOH52_2810 [Pseudonocardiales bacterium]|nr:hypothetical protein [Pseudonocardiales bacterium]